MENEQKPIMVIPKEKATFRLDKNGIWFIGDDKFTNQKIINYFHSVIKKDKDGFFLMQEHKHFIEKVYFPYEDTPLFVFHVIKKGGLTLILNTSENIELDPKNLIIRNENLYLKRDEDLVKFSENALVSLASYMEDNHNQYSINIDGKKYIIPEVD